MGQDENNGAVILGFPKKADAPETVTRPPRIDGAAPSFQTRKLRGPKIPETPKEVREQIFDTVRFVSYGRVNEVDSIEELIAETSNKKTLLTYL